MGLWLSNNSGNLTIKGLDQDTLLMSQHVFIKYEKSIPLIVYVCADCASACKDLYADACLNIDMFPL